MFSACSLEEAQNPTHLVEAHMLGQTRISHWCFGLNILGDKKHIYMALEIY